MVGCSRKEVRRQQWQCVKWKKDIPIFPRVLNLPSCNKLADCRFVRLFLFPRTVTCSRYPLSREIFNRKHFHAPRSVEICINLYTRISQSVATVDMDIGKIQENRKSS